MKTRLDKQFSIEKLQPKLRFPEFKGDWKALLFKDIYSFRSTNSFSRDKLNYSDGEVLNLHYGDIHTKFNSLFDVSKEIVPFINMDISIEKISHDNYLKKGDLVIADASEDYDDIGKTIEIVNLNDKKILAGLHTFIARPDKIDVAIGFGNYLMKTEKSKVQIKTIAQGTKVLSISATRLSDININLPSLLEQTKIASFLSAVDEKINLLKEKKTASKEYKKGMMQKIFSQEIRFKDENGKDFAEWEEKSLGETSKFYSGGTPLTTKKDFYQGSIPFIKSGEINGTKTKQFISEAGLKNSSAKLVSKGDILYALYGATSGEVAISRINGAINQAVLCIKSDLNHYFLYYYLTFQKENIINTYIQGGQGNLSVNIIKGLIIPFPSLSEQTKIASFLFAIDEKIALISTQIEETMEYKKGLLQQMFC